MVGISQAEIQSIYQQNFEKIYRFFYYKTLSKDLSEDLTSETFLGFVDQASRRDDIENCTGFLYGIARNVFLNYLKSKYKDPGFSVDPEFFQRYVEGFVEEKDSKETLEEKAMKYIQRLPEKQGAVAYMRLIQKMSPMEIATKLGKNRNYVKVTLRRALKSLRQLIECTP